MINDIRAFFRGPDMGATHLKIEKREHTSRLRKLLPRFVFTQRQNLPSPKQITQAMLGRQPAMPQLRLIPDPAPVRQRNLPPPVVPQGQEDNQPPVAVTPRPPTPEDVTRISAEVGEFLLDHDNLQTDLGESPAKEIARLEQKRFHILTEIQSGLLGLETEAAETNTRIDDQKYDTLMALAVDLAFPQAGINRGGQAAFDDVYRDIVAELTQMRQTLHNNPAERAKVSGVFLAAIAQSETVAREDPPIDRLKAAKNMLHALSKGDAIMNFSATTIKTMLPETRQVLSQLRANYYANVAATNFIIDLRGRHQGVVDDVVGTGRQKPGMTTEPDNDCIFALSPAEIRNILPEALKPDFDNAIGHSKKAAAARDAYDIARQQVIRTLGHKQTTNIEWALLDMINTIRDLNNDGESASTATEKEERRAARELAKLTKGNKAAPLLVARFIVALEKLADYDHDVLGYSSSGIWSHGVRLDSDQIMRLTRLSKKDAKKLGFPTDDINGIKQSMANFGNAGLIKVSEVKNLQSHMNSTSNDVLGTVGIQKAARAQSYKQTFLLAQRVNAEITDDAIRLIQEANDAEADNQDADINRSEAFRKISGALFTAIYRHNEQISPLGRGLNTLKGEFDDEYRQSTEKQTELNTLRRDSDRHQITINEFKVLNPDFGPGKRGQIEVVRNIMAALDAHEEQDDIGARIFRLKHQVQTREITEQIAALTEEQENLQRIRDEALQNLKGLRIDEMRLSPTGMLRRLANRSRRDEVPSIHDLLPLLNVMPAVEHLLENKGVAKELQKEIDQSHTKQIDILNHRAKQAPALFNAVNRIIFAAVIDNLPTHAQPDLLANELDIAFHVAENRNEIVQTLTNWGFPVDEFGPEIDHALSNPVDSKVMGRLRDDTKKLSFAQLFALADLPSNKPSLKKTKGDLYTFLTTRHGIDSEIRDDFRQIFNALAPGASYDMKRITNVRASTWKVPLDPSTTVRVRARCEVARLKNLSMGVDNDGAFRISTQSGVDLLARLDGEVTPLISEVTDLTDEAPGIFNRALYLRLGIKASIQGGLGAEGGHEVVFPATEQGREDAIKLLMALTEKEKISVRLLESSSNIMSTSKVKGSAKASLAGAAIFGVSNPFSKLAGSKADDLSMPYNSDNTGATNAADLGIEGHLGVERGKVWNYKKQENANIKTISYETESTKKFYSYRELYYSTFTVLGQATSAGMHLTGIQNAADENLQNRDGDGRYNGGNAMGYGIHSKQDAIWSATAHESRKYEYAKTGSGEHDILERARMTKIMDSRHLIKMINAIKEMEVDETTASALPQSAERLLELAATHNLKNTVFHVSYQLKPENVKTINALNMRAMRLRSEGESTLAKELERTANEIRNDSENYQAEKITLLQTSGSSSKRVPLNAMVGRVELKSEFAATRVLAEIDL